MAKFHGKVGYGVTTETRPGVYEEVITERNYFGDIIRTARKLVSGENVNSDITVSNSISIVADAYAYEHFFAMRYIKWAGTLWIVSDVEEKRPRLILRLGGVYNGPTVDDNPPTSTPEPPGNPDEGSDGEDEG